MLGLRTSNNSRSKRSLLLTVKDASEGSEIMNMISPTDTALAPRLIIIDKYDYIFYAALALLPVDGTVIGIRMPYWSPISPILFLCYVCLNWRLLHTAARPYLGFMLFPITVLLPLSAFAWSTYHFRLITTITTALGILGFLSCLLSLHIAFSIKKLSTSFAASIIGAAYWVAFVVGVIEFLALRLDIHSLRSYFAHLMLRPYNRPQFLFAEPSYIGMHVFGVLLPTYWMTKNKRLRTLVFTFVIGAFLIGSGLRIIIDSAIACVLWSLPHIKFNSRRNRLITIGGAASLIAATALVLSFNERAANIIHHGLIGGDGSMSARIFHAFVLARAWASDVPRFLIGFGAGNIPTVVNAHFKSAHQNWNAIGGRNSWEINNLNTPTYNQFTMSGYTSFITEFGILAFIIFIMLVIIHISINNAWNKKAVCWFILVAYLYIQFEGYAFYALPLFIWGIYKMASLHSIVTSEQSCTR